MNSSTATKIILCICVFVCNVQAQEKAYYLTNFRGADLLKVNTETAKIEEVISYKDTIAIYKQPKKLTHIERYQSFLKPTLLDSTQLAKLFQQSKIELGFSTKLTTFTDSILVDKEYYTIQMHSTVNVYVGGGPLERIDVKINVEGLGLLYSYSSYYNQHTLCMLHHENTEKQKIINAAYKYLEKAKENQSGMSWPIVLKLLREHTFENLVEKLESNWLKHQKNIKLIAQTTEMKDGFVYLTSTIKNVSDKYYCFLKSNESIAPAKLMVHYPNRKAVEDLSGKYPRTFMQGLKFDIYLNPDAEITFTQKLPIRTGCGDCEKFEYSGFQFVSYRRNLYNWLINPLKNHENKNYLIVPTQEIKK